MKLENSLTDGDYNFFVQRLAHEQAAGCCVAALGRVCDGIFNIRFDNVGGGMCDVIVRTGEGGM